MLIRAYSDLHGMLPVVEECDLLLIAGDVCPVNDGHYLSIQKEFIEGSFADWLIGIRAKQIIITPGNHDFIFQTPGASCLLPGHVKLLIDSGTEYEGIKIWGSPWVPNLPRWAFHASEEKIAEKLAEIPDDIGIWLTHGPPYMYLDQVVGSSWKYHRQDHVGSKALAVAIQEKQPELVVCGHIHEGFGIDYCANTRILNAAFVNENYDPQFRHFSIRPHIFSGELVMDNIQKEIGERELSWNCFEDWG